MRDGLFWIPGTGPGRLAIAARPRGGDWLEEEILSWRRAGVTVVVSLLTKQETAELHLLDEEALSCANGIEFVNFPVTDRGVPASEEDFMRLIQVVVDRLAAGASVVVHCRQGIGRAGLVALAVLLRLDLSPEAAAKVIGNARGVPVPETVEQRSWIDRFSRTFLVKAA